MPNINGLLDGTCVAKEKFENSDIGKFVVLSGDREVSIADVSAGDVTYGVLKNAGDAGEPVTVQLDGISLIQIGTAGTLSAGDLVKVTADGDVVEWASSDEGDVCIAQLREDPDSNDSLVSAKIFNIGTVGVEVSAE